ncbi:MAG: chemotaxis protein CheD [Propionivibrio sp.]|uniref:chemotaxis protein CheD n=1 Tax=Propionivibrio sp. TaxID=2212460 RepID=UPI001B663344|nr:chemotaxis protein CheD [Propionivibrio sp.]MBP7202144.1 chemotaxis protein CheD [Propionivibrio sp.]
MNTTDVVKLQAKEIERLARNVQPGAWSVDTDKPLSTLLGSCVAVCLFDPALKIGGINHFMLPEMGRSKYGDVDSLLSGNFAMEALLNALIGRGARKARLQAKAFGGGTIIDSDASAPNIGMRNASFAKEWLQREGIPLLSSDFLGPWSRKIIFLPFNGEAFCKRLVTNMATASVIAREERSYAETLLQKPKAVDKKIELF